MGKSVVPVSSTPVVNYIDVVNCTDPPVFPQQTSKAILDGVVPELRGPKQATTLGVRQHIVLAMDMNNFTLRATETKTVNQNCCVEVVGLGAEILVEDVDRRVVVRTTEKSDVAATDVGEQMVLHVEHAPRFGEVGIANPISMLEKELRGPSGAVLEALVLFEVVRDVTPPVRGGVDEEEDVRGYALANWDGLIGAGNGGPFAHVGHRRWVNDSSLIPDRRVGVDHLLACSRNETAEVEVLGDREASDLPVPPEQAKVRSEPLPSPSGTATPRQVELVDDLLGESHRLVGEIKTHADPVLSDELRRVLDVVVDRNTGCRAALDERLEVSGDLLRIADEEDVVDLSIDSRRFLVREQKISRGAEDLDHVLLSHCGHAEARETSGAIRHGNTSDEEVSNRLRHQALMIVSREVTVEGVGSSVNQLATEGGGVERDRFIRIRHQIIVGDRVADRAETLFLQLESQETAERGAGLARFNKLNDACLDHLDSVRWIDEGNRDFTQVALRKVLGVEGIVQDVVVPQLDADRLDVLVEDRHGSKGSWVDAAWKFLEMDGEGVASDFFGDEGGGNRRAVEDLQRLRLREL